MIVSRSAIDRRASSRVEIERRRVDAVEGWESIVSRDAEKREEAAHRSRTAEGG